MRVNLACSLLIPFLLVGGCARFCGRHEESEFERIEFSKSGFKIPIHTMTVQNTGEIHISIRRRLHPETLSAEIGDEELRILSTKLVEADFWSLKAHYRPEGYRTDQNTHRITVVQDGCEKSVRVYDYESIQELPSGLRTLIEVLEDMLESILGRDI